MFSSTNHPDKERERKKSEIKEEEEGKEKRRKKKTCRGNGTAEKVVAKRSIVKIYLPVLEII